MTDLDDIDLSDPDRFADGPPHDAYRRLRDDRAGLLAPADAHHARR